MEINAVMKKAIGLIIGLIVVGLIALMSQTGSGTNRPAGATTTPANTANR